MKCWKFNSKFSTYNSHFSAFTLAEILITLGIIGVIAALTLPILINNHQKSEYSTAAKKAYNQFNQILQQTALDNGTVGDISNIFSNNTAIVGAKIASFYKVVKTCGTTTGEECFAKFDDNYDGSAKTTTRWTSDINPQYKFITADGMSFCIGSFETNCKTNRGFAAAPESPTYNSVCGFVYVDVNGSKKPNNLGRDVFMFYITSQKNPLLYPRSGFYTSGSNTGSIAGGGDLWWNYNNAQLCGAGGKNGVDCTGRLMEKGWVMDY